MSTEEIDVLIRKAQSIFPKVRCTGRASLEEIKALECLAGKIPESYKYFLENYGTFGFYGLEIYGLIAGNLNGEGPPNAYYMTKVDRDDGSIPERHIVIGSTGYGPVYLLNCISGEVLEWSYTGEADQSLLKYPNFENFLLEMTEATLADYRSENDTSF